MSLGSRYLDVCLVAAGVRCAALLDTRRAPRGSAPLGDVLDALQEQEEKVRRLQQEQHEEGVDCADSATLARRSGVACLGLLALEGSLFLVNRALLLRRLEAFFSAESAAERRSSRGAAGDKTETRGAGTAAIGERSGRTSQPAPIARFCGGAEKERQRHGRRRTVALVDVRRALALPCERSDALAPRLAAALRSAFGGAVADDGVAIIHEGSIAAEPAAIRDRADRCGDDGGGDGGRWLRNWGTKELKLGLEDLRETLGDVGFCGLAGWLLEYPVVYCCPSQVGSPDDDPDRAHEGGGGATAANAMGNCLAGVPLTVYTLSVDLSDECGSASSRQVPRKTPSDAATGAALQAFSFSVPARVCGPHRAEGDEEGLAAGLHGLVDEFVGRLEARIARHRGSSGSTGCSSERQKERSVLGLHVTKRTETLDRVAL